MIFRLLQTFQFTYPDGFLFHDRAGAVVRRLQDLFPGLILKNAQLNQRDCSLPAADIDLIVGLSISNIQSLAPSLKTFPSLAARFLQTVTETFEITLLREFRFRLVLGKPCDSGDEARDLMWLVVGNEMKEKLNSREPRQWRALQGDWVQNNNLLIQSRVEVMDLTPHREIAATTESGGLVPHITFQYDMRGLVPLAVSEFDAEAFINNVSKMQMDAIASRLSPHTTA